jgi:hypothetical protein
MPKPKRRPPFCEFAYTAAMRLIRVAIALPILYACLSSGTKAPFPLVRWSTADANCSFRSGKDGRSYYAISLNDLQVVMAVDSKELEKIPHRATAMLSVLLSFDYRGGSQLPIEQSKFALEFVKHSHVTKTAFDPDDILRRLQENADDLTDQVERRALRKHPEQKAEREDELQQRLKDYTEMMDFISTNALRSTVLTRESSSAQGWVFFPIKDRWIGPWREPEQFVLRIPVKNSIVEFPFTLPPGNNVQLRTRPQ